MKKLFFLLSLSLFVLVNVSAQDTLRQRAQHQAKAQRKDRVHQEEHLVMQEGKLFRVQHGVRTQVQSPTTMQNGTVVKPDGSYQLQNGKTYRLHNGECLDMAGNFYKSQNQFNKQHMMTEKEMEQMNSREKKQQDHGNKGQQQGGKKGGKG